MEWVGSPESLVVEEAFVGSCCQPNGRVDPLSVWVQDGIEVLTYSWSSLQREREGWVHRSLSITSLSKLWSPLDL